MGVCLSTEPPDHNEEKCVLMKLNPCLQKWECCTNAPCLQGHQWEMYICRKTCLNQFKPVTSGPPASSSLLRTCYDVCMYVRTYVVVPIYSVCSRHAVHCGDTIRSRARDCCTQVAASYSNHYR